MSPRVFLVAAEESGDRLGAGLMAAIRTRAPHARFYGLGGAEMAAQGLAALVPSDDLAIVGFGAVLARLPTILRRIRDTAEAVVAARPDVLVIIDSPDFTHRVARRVRRLAPSIPIVNYVCPSVWAWRQGRARAMRGYIDHVLALLPFEPGTLAALGGPAATYVGHPLVEQRDALRPSAAEAARRRADPPVLLVLPGSRAAEIRRMAPVFGAAVARLARSHGPLDVVVPAVPQFAREVEAAVARWPVTARLAVTADDKHRAFREARAALTKSGTSTLELALAGVPMVAAYKLSPAEAIVAWALIRVPSVILANLVLGEAVVPEFLQLACRPDRLAAALAPLIAETPERRAQVDAFGRLDAVLGSGSPSARAAAVVLAHARGRPAPEKEAVASDRPTA